MRVALYEGNVMKINYFFLSFFITNIFLFFARICRTGLDESYDDFKSKIKMEKEGLSENEAIF